MSKLDDALRGRATPSGPAGDTALGRRFAATSLRGELVEIPGLGPAWIELSPHETNNTVEAEVFTAMAKLGLEPVALNGLTYEAERAVRTLARCVRDADDATHATPFGTVEQWGKLDSDLIAAAWGTYGDVRLRLDPVGADLLTDGDLAGIRRALEKKSAAALRSYGVAKLSRYLLTTAAPLETSRTPL